MLDCSFFFGPQRCQGCGEMFPFSQIRTKPIDDKTFAMFCEDCA